MLSNVRGSTELRNINEGDQVEAVVTSLGGVPEHLLQEIEQHYRNRYGPVEFSRVSSRSMTGKKVTYTFTGSAAGVLYLSWWVILAMRLINQDTVDQPISNMLELIARSDPSDSGTWYSNRDLLQHMLYWIYDETLGGALDDPPWPNRGGPVSDFMAALSRTGVLPDYAKDAYEGAGSVVFQLRLKEELG